MNKFYNNNANIWDNVWKTDVYSKPDLRKEKAAIKVEKLLKHITIDNSTMVLDLGCGGGYIARELYNKTRAQIYGIDSSNEAIQLSVDKSKEIPIRYQKADITELPFSDDFADVILCIGVIEHVKEYECCLKEIKRVLKSNGLVYVVSSNRDSFIYEQKIVRAVSYTHLDVYKRQVVRSVRRCGFLCGCRHAVQGHWQTAYLRVRGPRSAA